MQLSSETENVECEYYICSSYKQLVLVAPLLSRRGFLFGANELSLSAMSQKQKSPSVGTFTMEISLVATGATLNQAVEGSTYVGSLVKRAVCFCELSNQPLASDGTFSNCSRYANLTLSAW